jgi:hypothetical protein
MTREMGTEKAIAVRSDVQTLEPNELVAMCRLARARDLLLPKLIPVTVDVSGPDIEPGGPNP